MNNLQLDCTLAFLNEGKVVDPISMLSESITNEINNFNIMMEGYEIVNEKFDIKAALSNIKEKVIKFFKAICTFIKGIYEKIKKLIAEKRRNNVFKRIIDKYNKINSSVQESSYMLEDSNIDLTHIDKVFNRPIFLYSYNINYGQASRSEELKDYIDIFEEIKSTIDNGMRDYFDIEDYVHIYNNFVDSINGTKTLNNDFMEKCIYKAEKFKEVAKDRNLKVSIEYESITVNSLDKIKEISKESNNIVKGLEDIGEYIHSLEKISADAMKKIETLKLDTTVDQDVISGFSVVTMTYCKLVDNYKSFFVTIFNSLNSVSNKYYDWAKSYETQLNRLYQELISDNK